MVDGEHNSRPVKDFRGKSYLNRTIVGYAAMMERYHLRIPLPPRLAALSRDIIRRPPMSG
jgi:hypothetical protein